MNKVFENPQQAIRDIQSGAIIAVGGFGTVGIPENAIAALVQSGVRNLTCISNSAGLDDFGVGLLLRNNQVRKMISSYIGDNKLFESLALNQGLELEMIPQGTLAERLRAGGAGIPAFFTPTGVGTVVAEGKEVRTFEGRQYILEKALKADFGFVRALKGDTMGNLVFHRAARNFNPAVAAASKITVAEVEQLVPAGQLDPDEIHIPGIYVHRIFQGQNFQRRIEKLRVQGG